jgi:hypothetical protein
VVKAFLLLLLGIFPGSAAGQNKSWRIADFKDTISINRDAGTFVSEKITLVFTASIAPSQSNIPDRAARTTPSLSTSSA